MPTYTHFPNVGFVQHTFTEKQLKPIVEEIRLIQEDFTKATAAHNRLAGNIKNEFFLSEKSRLYLEYIMMPMTRTMYENNPQLSVTGPEKMPVLYLESSWVNFQKKHEFNPTHGHTGVYSFVIWIQVPFLTEDEVKAGPGYGGNHPVSGQFTFDYCDTTGQVINYGLTVDKTWENKAIMFLSSQKHGVYPFYSSDDYRISVSGNFYVKENARGRK